MGLPPPDQGSNSARALMRLSPRGSIRAIVPSLPIR
jgi:hypothetical protein